MTPGNYAADLATFLLARIAEDEAVARAASEFGNSSWQPGEAHRWKLNDQDDLPMTEAESAHIARHDPARVLAECAAKRALVERDARQVSYVFAGPGEPPTREEGTDTLRLLALPYADHPDYQEDWKP